MRQRTFPSGPVVLVTVALRVTSRVPSSLRNRTSGSASDMIGRSVDVSCRLLSPGRDTEGEGRAEGKGGQTNGFQGQKRLHMCSMYVAWITLHTYIHIKHRIWTCTCEWSVWCVGHQCGVVVVVEGQGRRQHLRTRQHLQLHTTHKAHRDMSQNEIDSNTWRDGHRTMIAHRHACLSTAPPSHLSLSHCPSLLMTYPPHLCVVVAGVGLVATEDVSGARHLDTQ